MSVIETGLMHWAEASLRLFIASDQIVALMTPVLSVMRQFSSIILNFSL